MAFSSLASNQLVSFNEMQSSGIPLKPGQSGSSSLEIMTKSDATTRYSLNLSNSFLAAKSNNQLVAKRDLETGDPATSTLTIYYESNQWWAELTSAIPSTGISIQAGVVRGYYDACLGAPDETVDMWSDSGKVVTNGFSLPAGFTISSGYTPFEQFSGSVINYNMINNVEINGVARTDGSTFTVGGTTVTLSLPLSCTPYS